MDIAYIEVCTLEGFKDREVMEIEEEDSVEEIDL